MTAARRPTASHLRWWTIKCESIEYGDEDRLAALNAADAAERWAEGFDAEWVEDFFHDDGVTVTVTGEDGHTDRFCVHAGTEITYTANRIEET